MSEFCRPLCGPLRLISWASDSIRSLNALVLAAALLSGCGQPGSVNVNGEVRLDGVPTSAEIQIEQLDIEGNRAGRSVTAYADDSGEFAASIEPVGGAVLPLDCRLVVRVSQLSSSGLPAAFDENAPAEKAIRLRRSLQADDTLSILLTQ